MKKYLYDYIESIDKVITNNKVTDEIIKEHLIKIDFFMHERLVHLLVTLAYAFFLILFLALSFMNSLFIFIAIIIIVFLIFYVRHYFKLENGVQYLYKQYDKLKNNSIL